MGSLSTHRIVGEEQQAEAGSQPPKRGPLSSLIYGTKEGQQLDRDIERSFSQVLARGKYVHSIVFHEVKPDKVDEYVDLVGQWYPRMAAIEENKVNLVGSWRTEVGDNDTFGTGCDIGLPRVLPPVSELTILSSPHLGVPALHRLPRLPTRHLPPSRVPRIRQEAQISDQEQEHIAHAGVLLLADDASTAPGRTLRAPVIYPPPGQSSGVGNPLAPRPQGAPGGHGGCRGLVRSDR